MTATRRTLIALTLCAVLRPASAVAQGVGGPAPMATPPGTTRMLVVPFEVVDRDPRAVWLGEAAAVLLSDALRAMQLPALNRAERVRAFEEANLPVDGRLSLASLVRVGHLVLASDLIVGNEVAQGELLHPNVEPRVRGNVAAYLELYLPEADPGGLTVDIEIAEGERTPALATTPLKFEDGSQPDWRVASGIVDVSVVPGKYVARATIQRDGKTVRTVSRPFVLERTDASVTLSR